MVGLLSKHVYFNIQNNRGFLVNLYDARRQSIDTSIISINTTSTCVCILRCGCSVSIMRYLECVFLLSWIARHYIKAVNDL